MTLDVILENPNREKLREPTDSNYHYEGRNTNRVTQRQRPRALFLHQQAVAKTNLVSLSLSLSLIHTLYTQCIQ